MKERCNATSLQGWTKPQGRDLVMDAGIGKGKVVPAATKTQGDDATWTRAGPGVGWEWRKRLPWSKKTPQPQEGQREARGSISLP